MRPASGKHINVSLRERSYPIYVESGIHQQLVHLIRQGNFGDSAFIVTQKPIWKAWKAAVVPLFANSGIRYKVHMPFFSGNSESMKSFSSLKKILKSLAKFDKGSKGVFVIAFGGGVVGDVGGFAAAVYKRGIPVIQVPTTLTAQVDSSVGGKTALDLPQGKNLVGTFHQPRFVLVDPIFLKTLPDAIFRDGMAEVIKYGAIRDMRLFELLEKFHEDLAAKKDSILEKVISSCCRIKAQIVSQDEFDQKGIRATLNFGHTLGHAIEAATKYKGYTHGQAVALGMIAASEISLSLRLMQHPSSAQRLRELIARWGLPVTLSEKCPTNKILKALLYDKKRVRGENLFILLKDLGRTMLYKNVPEELIVNQVRALQGKAPAAIKKPIGGNALGNKPKPVTQASRPAHAHTQRHTVRPHQAPQAQERRESAPRPEGVERPKLALETIGNVENYLSKIAVAIIKLEKDTIRIGDAIYFDGPTTRCRITVRSMQINRQPVEEAKAGDVIGMRVSRRLKPGDRVSKKAQ